jgi:hypothetical protein
VLFTGITFMTRCQKIRRLFYQSPLGERRIQRLDNARVNIADRTEHDTALRIPFIDHLVRSRNKFRARCLHGCWIYATNIALPHLIRSAIQSGYAHQHRAL